MGFFKDWVAAVKHPNSRLLLISNWKGLLTLLKDKTPCREMQREWSIGFPVRKGAAFIALGLRLWPIGHGYQPWWGTRGRLRKQSPETV